MFIDVSIVVPIYNVEQYLPDCLESILNQSTFSWEAILVDDGSSDNSAKIAKEFCAKDDRFKYFYQGNSGQGEARRKGIDYANGRYIFFLDSDDLISPKAIELMLKESDERHLDVTLSDYTRFVTEPELPDSLSKDFSALNLIYPSSFTREDISSYQDFYRSIYFTVVWGKLFRSSLLKSLNLPSLVGLSMGEDLMMTKLSMMKARSMGVCNVVSVYYRTRRGSMTNKRTLKSLDIFTSYQYMQDLYQSYHLNKSELILLNVAYFDYFIEHFHKFTPYRALFLYYIKMVGTLSRYNHESVEMVKLKSKNFKRVYLFDGGVISFSRLFLSCFLLNPFKSKVKKILNIKWKK